MDKREERHSGRDHFTNIYIGPYSTHAQTFDCQGRDDSYTNINSRGGGETLLKSG